MVKNLLIASIKTSSLPILEQSAFGKKSLVKENAPLLSTKQFKTDAVKARGDRSRFNNLISKSTDAKAKTRGPEDDGEEKVSSQHPVFSEKFSDYKEMDGKFFLKLKDESTSKEHAFELDNNVLSTKHDDEKIAHAMLEKAIANGWKPIEVSGTPKFREAVKAAAMKLNVEIKEPAKAASSYKALPAHIDEENKSSEPMMNQVSAPMMNQVSASKLSPRDEYEGWLREREDLPSDLLALTPRDEHQQRLVERKNLSNKDEQSINSAIKSKNEIKTSVPSEDGFTKHHQLAEKLDLNPEKALEKSLSDEFISAFPEMKIHFDAAPSSIKHQ